MPKMLTIRAAAREKGLTYNCIYRWIKAGEFNYYVKAGNRYLVNMDRLEKFLDSDRGASNENDCL